MKGPHNNPFSLPAGRLWVFGLSHQTSEVSFREKFFLPDAEKRLLLAQFKSNPQVLGAIILSTCNRTELYIHTLGEDIQNILHALFTLKGQTRPLVLGKEFYLKQDEASVRHLFSVASGLDSVVLGEKQILGQVKEAADVSRQMQIMSRELNILTHLAVRAGKKSQTETAIGCGGSSVSWAAVAYAQAHLGTLENKKILVIGAGKMGALAAEQLRNKKVKTVYVMNRSCDKAQSIAEQIEGEAVSFWDLKEILKTVDVVICSAGAPHYLIEKSLMVDVMPQRSDCSLLFIDISMPRNIDPGVEDVLGVKLVSIDELSEVVTENSRRRSAAICAVEDIVSRKVHEFFAKVSRAFEMSLSQ